MKPLLLTSLILLGPVLAAAESEKGEDAAVAQERPLWSRDDDTVERRAVEAQMRKDLKRISIGQASAFHRRFVETFADKLPQDLEFVHLGPLSLETGRTSQKIEGQGFTSALCWRVQKSLVVFDFWISTARTEKTVAACEIDGTCLYMNASFVDGDRSVDERLPELGGRSVREALKLLECRCDERSRRDREKP